MTGESATPPAAIAAAQRRAGRPARRRLQTRTIVRETLFYLAVVVVILIALFPFYWILRTSLLSDAAVGQGVGGANGIIPSHLTGSAYREVFKNQGFLTPLLNSALVAGLTTLITIVVGALAGYALARLPIRGAGAILGFILVAGFFPVLAMVGPLFLVLRDLSLLDSIWPLIIVYLVYTLPIATYLLRNFFMQIPIALEEAALVDGATRLQALRRVVIPVAVPGMFTAAILAFILAWNDFAFAVSFLETPGRFTAPLAIVNLGQSQFQVFYNRIDAAVVIITIPVALLVLFAQRRIVAGLTAGSFR